jgi:hypothetical protein
MQAIEPSVSIWIIVQLLFQGRLRGYSAILVFMDLTKIIRGWRALTLRARRRQQTVRLHACLPVMSIITDVGPVFTGAFWTTLFRSLGTQRVYPQSDGQTEELNGVLEDSNTTM